MNKPQIRIGHFMSAVVVATALRVVFSPIAGAQQFGPWSAPVNLGVTVNSGCGQQLQ